MCHIFLYEKCLDRYGKEACIAPFGNFLYADVSELKLETIIQRAISTYDKS